MKLKNIVIFCILMMLAFLFSSCSETDDIENEENLGGKKTVISDTIIIPMEKPETLNPIISSGEEVFFMSKLLYRSLFKLDENMAAVEDLVAHYEYLDDGSLSLTLKEGILWEDGTSLTAGDVKFTIDSILALPANNESLYKDAAEAIKSCRIEKDGSLKVAFFNQWNKDISNLLFPILPAHKHRRPADLIKDVNEFMPVGTGSYRIEEINLGESVSLIGSSDYMGFVPQNNLIFNYIRNKDDAINLFGTDEVNVALLTQTDRGTLLAKEKIQIHSFVSNEVEVLIFNLEDEKLQDPKTRRAIASAIDRETIVHNSYFQSGVLNDSLYFPNHLGLDTLFNRETREFEEGPVEKMTLRLIYNTSNNSRTIAAQLIKNDLEEIGINLTLEALNREEYFQAIEEGDFDLCLGGFKLNRKFDLRPVLQTQGPMNYAGYSNEVMDELLNNLQSGISFEAKKKILGQIENIYQREMPYVPLLYKTYGLAVTKGLSGIVDSNFDDIYKGIENWQIVYEVNQGS